MYCRLNEQPLWKRGSFGADAFVTPLVYDNFAGGFIKADETLKLIDKSPHHLLIIANERMFPTLVGVSINKV